MRRETIIRKGQGRERILGEEEWEALLCADLWCKCQYSSNRCFRYLQVVQMGGDSNNITVIHQIKRETNDERQCEENEYTKKRSKLEQLLSVFRILLLC